MPDTQSHKQCSKCKEFKLPSAYYVNRITCKQCHAAIGRRWVNTENGRQLIRQAQARFRKTEHGKEKARREARNYRINNPIKYRARMALAHAVRMGRVYRPDSCSQCGISCKPEAHHHNGYSAEHRIDVIWLCKSCHTKLACCGSGPRR